MDLKDQLDKDFELASLKSENGVRHVRMWVETVIKYVLLFLPAIAPVPNLVNLAIALSPIMGWGAAILVAVAFEVLIFGSAEIILYLQDKHMRAECRTHNGWFRKSINPYDGALAMASAGGLILLTILLWLILSYEVPKYGYAVLSLPFVSVISIVFLSLKRWADMKSESDAEKAAQSDVSQSFRNEILNAQKRLAEREREHRSERNEMVNRTSQLLNDIANAERSTREKDEELRRLNGEIASLREQIAEHRGQLSAQEKAFSKTVEKRSTGTKRTALNATEKREEIFNYYKANPKQSLGRAEKDLDIPKSTIRTYLEKLSENNRAKQDKNGKWSAITATIPSIEIHTNGHVPERI